MTSYEVLEFTSSYPLSSSLHMALSPSCDSPLSSSPPTGYVDHRQSLERDFCQNFTCCGLCLADLHELIEHFEIAHVVVTAADGTPIYPGNTDNSNNNQGSDSDSDVGGPSSRHAGYTPYTSHVHSYPQPYPPPEMAFSNTDSIPAPSHFHSQYPTTSNLDQTPPPSFDRTEEEVVVGDFDAFDTEFSSTSSSSSSPVAIAPPGLPPASFNTTTPTVPSDILSHPPVPVHNELDSSGQTQPKSGIGKITTKMTKMSFSERRRFNPALVPKTREKKYRCLNPGCVKSYLNANGLKYHEEKGTCKFEHLAEANNSPAPLCKEL